MGIWIGNTNYTTNTSYFSNPSWMIGSGDYLQVPTEYNICGSIKVKCYFSGIPDSPDLRVISVRPSGNNSYKVMNDRQITYASGLQEYTINPPIYVSGGVDKMGLIWSGTETINAFVNIMHYELGVGSSLGFILGEWSPSGTTIIPTYYTAGSDFLLATSFYLDNLLNYYYYSGGETSQTWHITGILPSWTSTIDKFDRQADIAVWATTIPITPTYSKTITSQSRVKITSNKTISSQSRIRYNYSSTLISQCRILIFNNKTITSQSCMSSAFFTGNKTTTSQSRIRYNYSQVIVSQGRIKLNSSITSISQSRIKYNLSRTTTSQSRIKINNNKTITSQTRIKYNYSQTITTLSCIKYQFSQTITSQNKVKYQYNQTITSQSKIQVNLALSRSFGIIID